MAEPYPQDSGTVYGTTYGHAAGGRTRRIWLWLLLLVLIVVLFTYDQGAMRDYGEKAYSQTETLMAKVSRKAKELYHCGLAGCKSSTTVSNASKAGGETVQPELAPTVGPSAAVEATSKDASGWAQTPSADEPSAATSSAPAANAPSTEGQSQAGASAYPAYPSYPPYPAYPPYSAFGANGANGASSEAATTSPTPPTVNAELPPPVQPYPTPAKPEAAPGKPAYPDYPAYPPSATASSTGGAIAASAPQTPQPPQVQQPQARQPQAQQPQAQQPQAQQPQAQQPQAHQPAQLPAPQLLSLPPAIRPDQAPAPVTTDGLAVARQVAMAGRLAESAREYHKYLVKHPNDGNAYGELGNVYMKLGRFSEAAQNYYEVATRLVDSGYVDSVAPLMPVMERHEPMLAALIQEKIARTRRAPPR
jgi:hypothetical protein